MRAARNRSTLNGDCLMHILKRSLPEDVCNVSRTNITINAMINRHKAILPQPNFSLKKKCARLAYVGEFKDGMEIDPNENTSEAVGPSRHRYRRFSHQCLPIAAIDCSFRPGWEAPIDRTRQPTVKPGPSNAEIQMSDGRRVLIATSKKSNSFIRRNMGHQRTEQPNAGMDPSSVPVYLTEAQNKLFFSCIVSDLSSDKDPFRCELCSETFRTRMDGRKHAVGHLRIMRLLCKLCGCGSFFCSDMRIHLQMRYCEMLEQAPGGVVRPGTVMPCMTRNQADGLIEIADKERPGHAVFTSGKIISTGIYTPYFPDPSVEAQILGSTCIKEMEAKVAL